MVCVCVCVCVCVLYATWVGCVLAVSGIIYVTHSGKWGSYGIFEKSSYYYFLILCKERIPKLQIIFK